MRVLQLVTDLQPGGTPLRIARLARGLRSVGVETTVGCLAAAGPVSADLEAAGIRTIACDARDVYDWQTLQRLDRQVRPYCHRGQMDLEQPPNQRYPQRQRPGPQPASYRTYTSRVRHS